MNFLSQNYYFYRYIYYQHCGLAHSASEKHRAQLEDYTYRKASPPPWQSIWHWPQPWYLKLKLWWKIIILQKWYREKVSQIHNIFYNILTQKILNTKCLCLSNKILHFKSTNRQHFWKSSYHNLSTLIKTIGKVKI